MGFVGVDPKAEANAVYSTYHYAGDNPIMFNDPLGDLMAPIGGTYGGMHGGYGRIGAGSGQAWYDGIRDTNNWNAWDGNASYRAGIAAGFQDINGDLYYSENGQKYKVSFSGHGVGHEGYGYKVGDDAGEAITTDDGRTLFKAVDTFEQIRFWYNFTSDVQDRFFQALEWTNQKINRFAEGFIGGPKSDFFSASAFIGYQGTFLTPTEKLLRFTANAASTLSDKAVALRGLKVATIAGKSIGVLGAIATGIESISDGKVTWGDGVKVGIGLLTTFTPWGWVYGAVDLGVGLATGTSLTDRIANGIDNL